MKINKNYDVESSYPKPSAGTNPFDNPQIQPNDSEVPDSPGERAVNDPAPERLNNPIPGGKKGSGY